jgi:Fuc2NAc and GlcNAc transferase
VVFAAALLFTGLWLTLAQRRNWFDHPNHRSSHVLPTPKSGGAGFVAAYTLFALSMYASSELDHQQLILVAIGLLLAMVGFVDDLRPNGLGIWQRIAVQVFASALVLMLLDSIPSIVFPWGALDSDWLRACLLLPALIWLINLYNFMDGLDGLAASETIFCCLALAALTSGEESATTVTMLSLGLAFAVSGFLYFNLPPARLFMGDLGSNHLGYMLGALGGLAVQSGSVNIWTLLVLLGVFIVDTTGTLVRRMRAGAVWYHAHRSHAYQQAALRLQSHGRVVLLVGAINVGWLLPLAWLTTVHERWGILITLVAWIPLHILGRLVRQPSRLHTDAPPASA